MVDRAREVAVRLAAFDFLTQATQIHGDTLPWQLLVRGFMYEDQRVPLVSQQGIFKPAILDFPLSIRTAPVVEGRDRPYDDEVAGSGLIAYRYRGRNPRHPDNVKLRATMEERLPLLYAFGITPGEYLVVFPIYVVGDNPKTLTFQIAVDDPHALTGTDTDRVSEWDAATEARRSYVTVSAKRRLHQEAFRQRVLRAYRSRCTVCRLQQRPLLDAGHILPDGHPRGQPIVPNGLALCKLHHAAFDRNLMGIRPDLRIEIHTEVLEQEDGPMLVHGLQEFQGGRIIVPRRSSLRPDPERLEERYAQFRAA